MIVYGPSILTEHPGHPNQKVHAGKGKVVMVATTQDAANTSVQFSRKDKGGIRWSRMYQGPKAARRLGVIDALARPSNPKRLLKRTKIESFGTPEARTMVKKYERIAGK